MNQTQKVQVKVNKNLAEEFSILKQKEEVFEGGLERINTMEIFMQHEFMKMRDELELRKSVMNASQKDLSDSKSNTNMHNGLGNNSNVSNNLNPNMLANSNNRYYTIYPFLFLSIKKQKIKRSLITSSNYQIN